MKAELLKLVEQQWYAWQMIPGYLGTRNIPYFSPILIRKVRPMKTGRGILQLDFLNLLYAEGVQDFTCDLRIIKHSENYLIAELINEGTKERSAIISHIEFGLIEHFCPNLWRQYPPSIMDNAAQSSVSVYLNSVSDALTCPPPSQGELKI